MRSFVIIGQTATASSTFVLDDLPGSGGRVDVLVRCIRAALLTSHGVRKDTEVFLVLLGGEHAPRTVHFDGANAKFLRPDERSLGVLLKKKLTTHEIAESEAGADHGFLDVRHGVSVARGDFAALLPRFDGRTMYVLSETAPDVRSLPLPLDAVIVLGDHTGFDADTLEALRTRGATFASLGPVSMHTDDAVTVMNNELDRRAG